MKLHELSRKNKKGAEEHWVYNGYYVTDNYPWVRLVRGFLPALAGLPPSSRGGKPVCWVRIFLPVRR